MSIVTYENVDTPVFEIDFLRYLFTDGEHGSLWGPLPYYSDAAGTVEAGWGDPVGNIPDASGNEQDWTQVTSTARPILGRVPVGGRVNQFVWTDNFLNPVWEGVNASVSAVEGGFLLCPSLAGYVVLRQRFNAIRALQVPITWAVEIENSGWRYVVLRPENPNTIINEAIFDLLSNAVIYERVAGSAFILPTEGDSFWIGVKNIIPAAFGGGDIAVVLSDTLTAGNTPGYNIVGTPDGDKGVILKRSSLSLTMELPPYQRVGNEYDITEAGVKGIHYLRFDGTDDQVTTTLPAISGGTIVLAGTNGIWIDEIDFSGGEFSVGPDTYTGGPDGLMPILGDILVEGGFVIDRALTPEEIAKVKGYYVARGAPGLIELGPETGQQPLDFTDGWTTSSAATVLSSTNFSSTENGGLTRDFGLNTGELYLLRSSFERVGGISFGYYNNTTATPVAVSSSSPGLFNHVFSAVDHRIYARIGGSSGGEVSVDYLSIRRLIMPGETP